MEKLRNSLILPNGYKFWEAVYTRYIQYFASKAATAFQYAGSKVHKKYTNRILFVFDEAREMLEIKMVEENKSLFNVIHRCFFHSNLYTKGCFALMLDTFSTMTNFQPKIDYDPSRRDIPPESTKLFPSYIWITSLSMISLPAQYDRGSMWTSTTVEDVRAAKRDKTTLMIKYRQRRKPPTRGMCDSISWY
jgi:hypothetical protein